MSRKRGGGGEWESGGVASKEGVSLPYISRTGFCQVSRKAVLNRAVKKFSPEQDIMRKYSTAQKSFTTHS